MKQLRLSTIPSATIRRISCCTFIFTLILNSAGHAQPKASTKPGAKSAAKVVSPRARAAATMKEAQRILFERKDVVLARRLFERAITEDPSFAAPRFNLAVVAQAREEWTVAQKWYEEFLAKSPDGPEADRARLEIEVCKRFAEEDATAEGKANRRYRESLALGRQLLDRDMAAEAMREAQSAIQLTPNRWEAYALAASIRANQNNMDGAYQQLLLAQKYAPSEVQSRLKEQIEAVEPYSFLYPTLKVTKQEFRSYLELAVRQAQLGDSWEQSFPDTKWIDVEEVKNEDGTSYKRGKLTQPFGTFDQAKGWAFERALLFSHAHYRSVRNGLDQKPENRDALAGAIRRQIELVFPAWKYNLNQLNDFTYHEYKAPQPGVEVDVVIKSWGVQVDVYRWKQ